MHRQPHFHHSLRSHALLIALGVLALLMLTWYVLVLNEQVRNGEHLRQVQRSEAVTLAMAAARPRSAHPGRRR
jgi:hypothetical protein